MALHLKKNVKRGKIKNAFAFFEGFLHFFNVDPVGDFRWSLATSCITATFLLGIDDVQIVHNLFTSV